MHEKIIQVLECPHLTCSYIGSFQHQNTDLQLKKILVFLSFMLNKILVNPKSLGTILVIHPHCIHYNVVYVLLLAYLLHSLPICYDAQAEGCNVEFGKQILEEQSNSYPEPSTMHNHIVRLESPVQVNLKPSNIIKLKMNNPTNPKIFGHSYFAFSTDNKKNCQGCDIGPIFFLFYKETTNNVCLTEDTGVHLIQGIKI